MSASRRCETNPLQNHPLRLAAKRLRAKANTLLKNITDRKERLDPTIPAVFGGKGAKVNGVNGHSATRPRPVAFTKSPSPAKIPVATSVQPRRPRGEVPFPESYAIVRTADGMTAFAQLDQALDARLNNQVSAGEFSGMSLEEKLREFSLEDPESSGEEGGFMAVDSEVGEKRKL